MIGFSLGIFEGNVVGLIIGKVLGFPLIANEDCHQGDHLGHY